MCMFPKICVIYQQTESLSSLLVVFVALDMRTSFLLFILTAAKHTFTGVYAGPSMPVSSTVRCEAPEPPKNAKTPDKLESRFRMQCIDGYVRKAGTSNLYRCEEKNHAYLWVNLPSLTCIPDPLKPIPTAGPTSTALTNTQAHTPAPNLTLSTSSAPVTTYYTTKGKTQSTSTTSGQTALTTTHTVPTTTGTFVHRTTTKEETTTNRNTLSSSSTLTIRENLTTVSPQFTHSSINTTTTVTNTQAHTPAPNLTLSTSSAPVTTYCTTKGKTQSTSTTSEVDGESKAPVSDPTKNGIAAGTVLILIVAVASAVGVFLWCRRSRKRELNPAEEMISPAPSSDKPLLELATSTSFSDSVQNPDSLPTLIVQHA
ncbi:interleukin-15 receptor subunit alpha isoform X3 [Pygocentrus nattereri]|uniref:interleukin-15 receptor subunit alpha isoform X3 n=1 Tax=Pygocentrus nattereri TaxID=42514 RepID=UPI0008149A61|nr:interleukin-15 receptor subunit alpha isoform X3 [Pygocentrus nattereri]